MTTVSMTTEEVERQDMVLGADERSIPRTMCRATSTPKLTFGFVFHGRGREVFVSYTNHRTNAAGLTDIVSAVPGFGRTQEEEI